MKPLTSRTGGRWAAALLLGSLPAIALANDGPYLGLEGGWNYQNNQNLSSGASARFDNGYVAGFSGGYALPNGLRPELEFDWRRNEIRKLIVGATAFPNAGGFGEAGTGFANLWYDFKGSGLFARLHPYLGGGVGVAVVGIRHYNNGGGDVTGRDTVFAWQGGAGIAYDLTQAWSVSLDYRYVQSNHGDFNDGGAPFEARYRANSALFGVRYSFGMPTPPPKPAAAPPPPAPVVPPPAPKPIGDSDGDGVPDNLDKCPGTPRGFKVDKDGCIVEQSIVLRAVNFEFNSDKLTAPAMETLDQVARGLIGQPSLNVEITGHTDSRGSAAYNLRLSQKRADSVRRYLIERGVKATNLRAKGYGATRPIASNETADGRAENRRVEFRVLDKPVNVRVKTRGSTAASKSAAESGEPHSHHKKK